jgi:hypothetical protein
MRRPGSALIVGIALVAIAGARAGAAFTNFESGHVRPLALSPDGSRLFAVDTPDNRLEIYTVGAGTLTLSAEVQVGLEPVAVAARTNTEVWVVNHLSDSVSVVQMDATTPDRWRVVRTLLTCDEPRDIVFAGAGGTRAFVTTARRGQNCPVAANPTTAGTGRALVQVWEATALGAALGGTPIANVVLFGDTPRALAKSTDGTRVYAAVFHSGNRTTTINANTVANDPQGLPPDPVESVYPTPKPPVGLIVRFNGTTWKDERSTSNWNGTVPFSLPDQDVFILDATAATPGLAGGTNNVVGVGTVIFNMAVRPNASGQIYVTNTDARNDVRFEPRIPSTGGGVQGHIVESRITVVNGTTPTARHLNPQIDFTCVPPTCANNQVEIEQSLAFPTDLTFSSNGSTVYVTGFGSQKIGIFDAAQLEAGNITGSTKHLVEVGQGPSGVALDEAHNQLFVMNRIEGSISIVANASSAATAAEVATVPLRYDPSPPVARIGREFLYDARHTSAHGDDACASCHIFGDFDSLAWDLSNPLDPSLPSNDNPFRLKPPGQNASDFSFGGDGVGIACPDCVFHPMKGPMTTQTLRGMGASGPMHWRGDRTGSTTGQDPLDEDLAFKAFNPAFVGLLGHDTQLSAQDMQDYTNFILTVALPPNPNRNLDDSFTSGSPEANGSTFFHNTAVDGGILQCVTCHRDPLGTDGLSSFEGEAQEFKIAHLRNLYQKLGMFGVPPNAGIPATGNLGNQIRGFGFLHDGSVATVFNFLQAPVFNFGSGGTGTTNRRNVEAFALQFDTGLAPAVGQQVTVTPSTVNDSTVATRIDLLIGRDDAGRCDLVVKGRIGGVARGWVYVGSNNFQPDRNAEPAVDKTTLRNLAATAGQELTYTCVPPGSGTRIGVDRDEDGTFDRRELDCGTDPADPASVSPPTGPCGATTTTTTVPTTTTTTTTSTTTTTHTTTTITTSTTTTTHTTTTTTTSTTTTTHTTTTTTLAGTTSTTTTTVTTSTTTTTTHTTTTSTTTSSTTTTSTVTTSSTTATTGATTTTTTASTTTTTTAPAVVLVRSTALTLRDRSTPPPDPNRRKMAFRSVTNADPAANQVVVPARGAAGDPTPGGPGGGGALLEVYNSAGSGEKVSVQLPASGWTAYDDSATPRGYRYKSAASTDAITRVIVKANQIRVRGGRSGWGYTLDALSQTSIGIRLRLGTGIPWCTDVPAKTRGNPASSASYDHVDKFVGGRVPPPPSCPPVP